VTDPYSGVIGQERAVAQLRAAAAAPVHAYLLVGPPGSGKHTAALAFAASLLCPDGACGECSVCRRVLHGTHPDVMVVERTGPYITVKQAAEIARAAAMSPSEGSRRVLILVDFHLVEDAAPALLKTIEEPPPTTFFIVLADYVPPELVTIASRCARVDFDLVGEDRIVEVLRSEGIEESLARDAARSAGGRVDRARLLAADPEVGARRGVWEAVPARLDGTGAMAAVLATELAGLIAGAGAEALAARHAADVAELEERVALTGERGSGRKDLEDRQRREQRRLRTDELRFGLAVLEGAYRDRAASAASSADHRAAAVRPALDAVRVVQESTKALERNPNESLLLQSLMVRLTPRS
jgi:DNA polymerase-3 subunit delta'